MKKAVLFFIVMCWILSACNNSDNSTNPSTTKSQNDEIYGEEFIKKLEGLDFTPELPQYIPYKNFSKEISVLKSQGIVSIIYTPNKSNMGMNLEIFKGDINLPNTGEKIELDHGEGTYINAENAYILKWKKNNLSYTISSSKNGKLKKEDLIEIANSFKTIK